MQTMAQMFGMARQKLLQREQVLRGGLSAKPARPILRWNHEGMSSSCPKKKQTRLGWNYDTQRARQAVTGPPKAAIATDKNDSTITFTCLHSLKSYLQILNIIWRTSACKAGPSNCGAPSNKIVTILHKKLSPRSFFTPSQTIDRSKICAEDGNTCDPCKPILAEFDTDSSASV